MKQKLLQLGGEVFQNYFRLSVLALLIVICAHQLATIQESQATAPALGCSDTNVVVCNEVGTEDEWRRWENLGPGGGGYFMHSAIGSDGSYLVGSDLGGAFLSSDNGATWSQLGSEQGLEQTHAASVAFHHTNPSIIFVGTDTGIFRSADGGASFTHVHAATRICMIATSATRSYAAMGAAYNQDCNQILVSTNDGVTWTSAVTLPNDSHIQDIRINPVDDTEALFVSNEGRFFDGADGALNTLYETNDGGVTANEVVTGYDVYSGAWSNDGTITYITTKESSDTGRLISKPAGYNSTQTEINSSQTGMIWVPPGTSNTIRLVDRRLWGSWMSGEGMYESTNGGTSFTEISSISPDHEWGWTGATWAYNHREIKEWAFSKYDANDAIYTTNQFVRSSQDGGDTFQQLYSVEVSTDSWVTNGLDNTVPAAIAQHPLNDDFVMVGYLDLGCWLTTNGGDSWDNCNQNGLAGGWQDDGGNTRGIVMDPLDQNKVWITNGEGRSGSHEDYILRSTGGGVEGTWSNSSTGLPTEPDYIDDLVLDDSSTPGSRRLFAAVDGDIYRSEDDGVNWSLVYACGDCQRIGVDGATDTVLVGGNTGAFVSTSNGDLGTWSSITLPGFSSSGSHHWQGRSYEGVTDIEADPNSSGVLWLSAKSSSGGIFKYDNGTTTREHSHIYARSVEVDATTGHIYMGSSLAYISGGHSSSSQGVVVSMDDGATWNVMDTPMDFPYATDIYIPESDTSTMWVLNPGKGIWKVDTTPDLSTTTVTTADANGGTLQPTDTVNHTLTISNTGNGIAEAVDILSAIDSNTENLSNIMLSNCGSDYSNSSTASTLDIDDLIIDVGIDCVITFDSQVAAEEAIGESLDSQVTVDASRKGGSGAVANASSLSIGPGQWDIIVEIDADGDSTKELLLYKRGAVKGTAAIIDKSKTGFDAFLAIYANWANDWTHITPIDLNGDGTDELSMYKQATGQQAFFELKSNGSLGPMLSSNNWRAGWDEIRAFQMRGAADEELFLYDRQGPISGKALAAFYQTTNRNIGQNIRVYDKWSNDWTHIVPVEIRGDARTELLMYKSATGLSQFFDLKQNGYLNVLRTDSWRAGWDEIRVTELDGPGRDELFFYDQSGSGGKGLGAFHRTTLQGIGALVTIYPNLANDWTTIIPYNFNANSNDELYMYKAGDGTSLFFELLTNGSLGPAR